jgi:c-di-GMP-binding flagellar brake protein YcgR
VSQVSDKAARGLAVLELGCDRNLPLSLHYDNPAQLQNLLEPDTLLVHSRLLRIESEGLAIDFPHSVGHPLRLHLGTHVQGYFTVNDTIYTFRTTVLKTRHRLALNVHKKIEGFLLAMPDMIVPSQRREDHRISVSSIDPITIALHEADPENPGAAPLDAKVSETRLINVSRGGVAVRVETRQRLKPRTGQQLFISLMIPGEREAFVFLAEVRHIRRISQVEAVICGLRFLRWPDQNRLRAQLAGVSRFVGHLERTQLKNRCVA